jgi:release factor glutamine methyltransferase
VRGIGETVCRNAVGGETVGALHRSASQRLKGAFAEDDRLAAADLDARLLVGHALGLDASGLIAHADRPVGESDVARVLALVERRIAGEPVARIVGEKEFWSLSLHLSPETLVPRPDTETVVEAALAWAWREGRARDPLTILDLGTGTGAILLALLSELPVASGIGVDIAEGAARTASANALRLGLGDRARFAVADWTAGIAGRFDIVVSNPPYIKIGDIPELPLEVSRFDPQIALDGGTDGLDAHRAILARLDGILAANGAAFLEVGAGQAQPVSESAELIGFEADRHKDLVGIDRVVELRRGKRPR